MSINSERSLQAWMDLHADVLIPHTSPRFYLGRTPDGNICRVARDLPKNLAKKLKAMAGKEPVTEFPIGAPVHAEAYAEVLAETSPIKRKWLGPAYYFPEKILAHSFDVVQITGENIDLLQPNHKDWIRAVGHRDPVCVLLDGAVPVSICFSPAKSDLAHEAGVDTLESSRGRGYGVFVVASWAKTVRSMGIEPLYSTSSDNSASQAVAAKLGLHTIGMDFHLT